MSYDAWKLRAPEDDEPGPTVRTMPRWVWCPSCERGDDNVNQRVCRHCGSARIESRGGGVIHGRQRYAD